MKTKDDQPVLFINVKYNDVDPATYKGISVRALRGRERVFNTNSPTFDFCCASIYLVATCKDTKNGMIMCGSSVDHFEMDGGDIDTMPSKEMLQIAKDYLITKNILPFGKIKVK